MNVTRREALGLLGTVSAAAACGAFGARTSEGKTPKAPSQSSPTLAPGAPTSPERRALVDAFKAHSAGIESSFEARTHQSDWVMPYRLFKPEASGKLPLVVYLHGSGGLGADNVRQMGLGNIFGTRLWALPEHQKEFPCYVVAPQTDRGWMNYGPPAAGDSVATVIPGLGDGARVAFDLIARLVRELPIDDRRIYITGQSMGGGGAWHMISQRPAMFAAAAICCGTESKDNPADAVRMPIWNFQGDSDAVVPPSVSRDRIAALRKAGGHPISTEYVGVGHNVWEWAYTEPALIPWLFSKRRS